MKNEILNQWLESPFLSEEEKNLIKNMSNDQKSVFFSDKKLKFGTAGVREVMGPGTQQMNRFVYSQLTEGYSKWLLTQTKKPRIIIARDNRNNGDIFQKICSEVASSFGIEVFLIDENRIKATPIVSYLVKEMKLDGAIIITASHNPKNYNGYKIYKKTGGQLVKSETDKVEELMPESKSIISNSYILNKDLIKIVPKELEDKYLIDSIVALIKTETKKDKNFPIIYTPHHGTAVNEMKIWLNSLGYSNVIVPREQGFIDPNFINSPTSNPEDKGSFELSLKYAKENSADIMLGSDPDADRLAIVVKHNGEWNYLTGNDAGIIFTEYVIANKKFNKKPMVVSTHVSTKLVEIICKKNNVDYFKTGTGFKWLGEKVYNELGTHDLVVAFEEAIGSLNSTVNNDKDSFQAAALILEIHNECLKNGKTLIDYKNDIFKKYGFWSGTTIAFLMDALKILNWKDLMKIKMEEFKKYKPEKIGNENFIESRWNDDGDCLEWDFSNNNTIKFRMSGTEPKFKAYINSFGTSEANARLFLEAAVIAIKDLYSKF